MGLLATRSRTTSRTCTTTPGSRPRRRRRCARRSGGCTSAARSVRATPATRTTARPRPGTSSARSASTRCRSAARTTRSDRRCSPRRRCTSRTARPRRQRAENSARNVYVQGLRVNGRRHDLAYLTHAARRRRDARVRHGPAAVALGDRREPRRRRSRPTTTRGRCATAGGATASGGDAAAGLFDDSSGTDGHARRRAAWISTASPVTPSAGALLHADLRHGRPSGPRSWMVKGSNDGAPGRCSTSGTARRSRGGRRPAPSSSFGPGNYAYYRIEGPDVGRHHARRDRAAEQREAVTAHGEGAGRPRRSRRDAAVDVVVSNTGDPPASGQITFTSADGWTVSPATAAFGPIRSGASQTVTFHVAVPAGTEPGDYGCRRSSRRSAAPARRAASST